MAVRQHGVLFSLMRPFRILIAPDKFKGTLTCDQAARAIEKGLRGAWPEAQMTRFSMTDGGEGFVELMVRQTKGWLRNTATVDAAGRPRRSRWGVLGNGHTAVIGLPEASGIAHLPLGLRNPERTTNSGTGRLIQAALKGGYREILIGLGGSAPRQSVTGSWIGTADPSHWMAPDSTNWTRSSLPRRCPRRDSWSRPT
jgi:glycerate kinase